MYTILNAYGKRQLIKIPIQERKDKNGKHQLSPTRPNKETTIEEAIRRYQPDANRDIRTFYEAEGLEMPNFAKMDRLEQLMLLADVTEKRRDKEEEMKNKVEKDKKAKQKAEIDKRVEEEVKKKVKPNTNEGTNAI